MPLKYTFLSIILKPGIEVYTKMKYFFTTFALKVSAGDGGRLFDTLQEYIFTLLNRHQCYKELVFFIFYHLT